MNFDLSSPIALSGLRRKEKKRPVALKSKSKLVSSKAVRAQQSRAGESSDDARCENGAKRREQVEGVDIASPAFAGAQADVGPNALTSGDGAGEQASQAMKELNGVQVSVSEASVPVEPHEASGMSEGCLGAGADVRGAGGQGGGDSGGQGDGQEGAVAQEKRVAGGQSIVKAKRRAASQRRASVGAVQSLSQPLPPVETPPTKVLLAEPLSERKARLQRSGGKRRGKKVGSEEGGDAGDAVEGGENGTEDAGGAGATGGTSTIKRKAGKGKKVTNTTKSTKSTEEVETEATDERETTKTTKVARTTKTTNTTRTTKAAKTRAAGKKKGAANGKEEGEKVTRASKRKKVTDENGSDGANGSGLENEDGSAGSDDPSGVAVTSGALTTTTTKNIRTGEKEKEPQASLADLPLDSEGWSLKDIVKWGSARERRMAKENAKLAPKPTLPPTVPMHQSPVASLTPKVRVVDGKIVVDEESLTVAAQQKEEYTKVVTEESHTINSMSYVNRLSNDRWSVEDTELFFRALSQFGTDFSLMAMLFPGRMRKHLKKKFCKESKVSPERIDAAMRASAHATLGSYREMIDLLKNSKGIKN